MGKLFPTPAVSLFTFGVTASVDSENRSTKLSARTWPKSTPARQPNSDYVTVPSARPLTKKVVIVCVGAQLGPRGLRRTPAGDLINDSRSLQCQCSVTVGAGPLFF